MNKKFIIIPIMLIIFMFACGDSERVKELEKQLDDLAMKQECESWKQEYLFLNQVAITREPGTDYHYTYYPNGQKKRDDHASKYNVLCTNFGVEPPSTRTRLNRGQY